MAASSTQTRTEQQPYALSRIRWPSNVLVLGLILDAEHVCAVPERIPNEEACQLLALWRREVHRFPYCVVGGELTRPKAGIIGGLAAHWAQALELQAYVKERFDYLSQVVAGGFSSAWGLHLVDARRDEILGTVAATMHTAGGTQ